jgi:Transposase DDE domain group 1
VAQRVYGLALGSEDLSDHEEVRNDPLLAVLVEKADPSSQALAGKSTLNRLGLTKETASRKERYKKIVLDHGAVDRLLVEVCLEAHREAPKEIILDPRCYRRSTTREAGRAFLPWLLWHDCHGQIEGVGELRLELGLPDMATTNIPATDVGEDEELARATVTERTFPFPRAGDGMSGESGSIVRDSPEKRSRDWPTDRRCRKEWPHRWSRSGSRGR